MKNNQKIFDVLADAEANAFYAYAHCENMELKKFLKKNHESAKRALEEFAKATGCQN